MTRTDERIEAYEVFYNAATDSYDLDAYAEAVTLDNLGMWTPAYEALVRGDLAVMEAYNDEHDTDATAAERARYWLARFSAVVYAWPFVVMIVSALAVAAL